MMFSSVIGHEDLKNKLRHAFQDNRVSHAQLFLGPAGCGNLALALAYSQYMFCEHRTDQDSCGSCLNCKKVQKLEFPDLHFSFPYLKIKENTSDDFLSRWREATLKQPYFDIESWRHLIDAENKKVIIPVVESKRILRKLSLKSFEGGMKIMVVWMPEYMGVPAANKLLKIIEEPPDSTLFILVAENADNILPTIMSRLQLVKVPKLSDEEIRSALISRSGLINNEKIEQIVQLSDGNYLRAQEAINRDAGDQFFDRFVDWMRMCYSKDVKGLYAWSDNLHKEGRENVKAFLDYALHMMRQSIVSNYTGGQLSRFGPREADFASKFAPFINDRNVIELNEELNRAYSDVNRNAYSKLVLMDMSLTVHGLMRKN